MMLWRPLENFELLNALFFTPTLHAAYLARQLTLAETISSLGEQESVRTQLDEGIGERALFV